MIAPNGHCGFSQNYCMPMGWDGGSEKRKCGEWRVANEQNLIPFSERTESEQRNIRIAGGVASGVARRRKKTLADLAKMIAENPASAEDKARLAALGVNDENATNDAVIAAAVYEKARCGNIDAVDKWESYVREESEDQKSAEINKALATAYKAFYENAGQAFYEVAGHALSHNYTHFDESGGRGSMKSSFVSLIVPLLVMGAKDHDRHALVLRKVANTLRDSVYAQYLWAIDKLGVAEYWEAKKTPMELVFKLTGQKIMFRGSDDPMKIKSIKVPFGYIAITHFEEKDQFAGRAEIRNILQSTMRGGTDFWNFESYNPPISRDNWANKDSLEERPDRFCHKSTYESVQKREWLGEQFYAEAEHLKETNARAYEHEYLGNPVGTGGNVFENLELREITDKEVAQFDKIFQGADWGWYPDPFAFIRIHYDKARETLYFIDEIYENKLTNEESANRIKAKKYTDAYVTCDSAEPKSVADYRASGIPAKEAIKGPGSVEYGMKWLQRRKIVIDRKRTPNAYNEFVNYEYERNKEGEIISGYPDENNHLIDATRYAMERVFNKYGSKA